MSTDRYANRSGRAQEHVRRIGRRIAYHRQTRGWSRRELARRTGYTAAAVNQWEDGHVLPRVETQFVLADLFGVDPETLFGFGVTILDHLNEDELVGRCPSIAPGDGQPPRCALVGGHRGLHRGDINGRTYRW